MGTEFLVAALIVVMIPGTGVIYTVATGLARGRAASVAAALGCTLGIVPAILASVAGLAALLHASALVFQAVKYAGAAYLLYLAWQTLREAGPLASGDNSASVPPGWTKIARTGCLINVLNPKLTVFFLAFLPQFVAPQAGSPAAQMVGMGLVFMAMTFAVFVVYGFFAAAAGERVLRNARAMAWIRRTVAVAFAGFGLRLALSER
ncbi:LysE family translocator [Stappia sp. ES.058]|uniref:LysE family translocator n=1 Tax=Stappia sp. ES.058 TaxID=1881061 RepID=UPI00087AFE63|nr:LysE family translocator [Stappia sp. ES.058]SDU47095.1 Threonine/homoserine/homoserine lactone efflux protein [Stappia sp. ES.058]